MRRILLPFLLVALSAPIHAAITFDSSMESGNGVNFTEIASQEFTFEIEPDTNSDDRQWFLFSVMDAQGEKLTFRLQDIDQSNVPEHWALALPVASSDGGETWMQISGDTAVSSGEFIFMHTIGSDSEMIAYHCPYTHSRLMDRIASWGTHPDVTHSVVGQSVLGRDIDLLTVTTTPEESHADRFGFWIICREHSAEVTGSWMLEGLMEFLLSDDPRAMRLRRDAVTNVIPMINPDGAALGNYRDNAMGANLNVVWGDPASPECPEVPAVIDAIDAWVNEGNSYDLFASLHSASAVTINWAYHASDRVEVPHASNPGDYSAELDRILSLIEANAPDFLASEGLSHSSRPDISRQYMMLQYGVLSLLFEGTYNPISFGPHAGELMSPERHGAIGRALGIAMHDYFIGEGDRSGISGQRTGVRD